MQPSSASPGSNEPPQVRAISPPQPVPVFNCVVYVARQAEANTVRARVVNLPGIEAVGASEREVLQRVVTAFKEAVARAAAAGETLAFITPAPLAPGESQRLIAVHL